MDTEIEQTSAAESPETEMSSPAESPKIGPTSGEAKSIFRAPSQIRYSRVSDFEPKLVSIGPYYHKRENLKYMYNFKVQCIKDLLRKRPAGSSNTTDTMLVESFMQFESIARQFYKEFNHNSVEFVEMLIRDSCFIIRIILSLSDTVRLSMPFLDVNIKEVRSDLLLLENQIPLFFIREVFIWLFEYSLVSAFETALERFINLDMPLIINLRDMSRKSVHLLDLCWLLLGVHHYEDDRFRKEQPPGQKPTVHLFSQRGIMRMPWLKIDSNQTTLLINLIAFEDCIYPKLRTVSPYIKLMDALIDSEKDVELLQQYGVISNSLSSHKMAATFFNDIGNFCFIDHDRYEYLYENVQKYYDSIWNRSLAVLRQNYFSSPWSYISMGAGTVLLILSAVQTHYTIHPNH